MPNAEAQVCRLSPLLLSRWEVGAMKQPYRSPESADLLVRGLVPPPQKQFHICSSVCPSVCGEEMRPCGLAAFHPIQLGLMGTFRYFYCHCVYMFLYLYRCVVCIYMFPCLLLIVPSSSKTSHVIAVHTIYPIFIITTAIHQHYNVHTCK